eukprot:7386077-Prymnesium_polylepis.1
MMLVALLDAYACDWVGRPCNHGYNAKWVTDWDTTDLTTKQWLETLPSEDGMSLVYDDVNGQDSSGAGSERGILDALIIEWDTMGRWPTLDFRWHDGIGEPAMWDAVELLEGALKTMRVDKLLKGAALMSEIRERVLRIMHMGEAESTESEEEESDSASDMEDEDV